MKSKSLFVLIAYISLLGCSSAKLKDVQFTETVHGKPCVYRGEGEGEITVDDREDDISGLRKEAEAMKANTVLISGTKNKGPGFVSFFECKDGLPLYWEDGIWFAKPLHEPKSKSEFAKAWGHCKYEVHKALIDTSHKNASRVAFVEPFGIPTGNTFFDSANLAASSGNLIAQYKAIEQDKKNEEERSARLSDESKTLMSECLEIQGFSAYRSTAPSAEKTFSKNCQKQNNQIMPCFVENP